MKFYSTSFRWLGDSSRVDGSFGRYQNINHSDVRAIIMNEPTSAVARRHSLVVAEKNKNTTQTWSVESIARMTHFKETPPFPLPPHRRSVYRPPPILHQRSPLRPSLGTTPAPTSVCSRAMRQWWRAGESIRVAGSAHTRPRIVRDINYPNENRVEPLRQSWTDYRTSPNAIRVQSSRTSSDESHLQCVHRRIGIAVQHGVNLIGKADLKSSPVLWQPKVKRIIVSENPEKDYYA